MAALQDPPSETVWQGNRLAQYGAHSNFGHSIKSASMVRDVPPQNLPCHAGATSGLSPGYSELETPFRYHRVIEYTNRVR